MIKKTSYSRIRCSNRNNAAWRKPPILEVNIWILIIENFIKYYFAVKVNQEWSGKGKRLRMGKRFILLI